MLFRNLSYCALLLFLFISLSVNAYEQEIEQITAQMKGSLAGNVNIKKVAVVDFTDLSGNVTQLGRFLAEEVSTSLANANREFQVVERTYLAVLVKEHKLSSTGLIDPTTAKKLGKVAGVDALIIGTLTPTGDSVKMNIKVLDTESAVLIFAKRGSVPKTQTVGDLLKEELVVSSAAASDSVVEGQKKTGLKKGAHIEQAGYKFNLRECQLKAKSLVCHMLITSLKGDKTLRLKNSFFNSRTIDESGNEHWASALYLGSGSCQASQDKYCTLERSLAEGIPIKAALKFDGLSEALGSLALLEINAHELLEDGGHREFTVHFKDVAIIK